MQSTLAAVPARLGVIPAMVQAGLLHGNAAAQRGCDLCEVTGDRSVPVSLCPCPSVPTCSCGARALQAGAAASAQEPAGCSAIPAFSRAAFPWEPNKRTFWFFEPSQHSRSFYLEQLNFEGVCVRRKRSESGNETPLAEAHLPPAGQGPWASMYQSAEPGFRAALSCVSANYNSLFFFFFFFSMQSSKSTELFWCRAASWRGLVCDSRRARGWAVLQLQQGWDGGGGRGETLGSSETNGSAVPSRALPSGVIHFQPQGRALQEVLS